MSGLLVDSLIGMRCFGWVCIVVLDVMTLYAGCRLYGC